MAKPRADLNSLNLSARQIRAIRSGDQMAALDALSSWRKELRTLAARYARNRDERDDLFQEAQLSLWQAILNYPVSAPGSFVAFARTCLRNRMIDLRRAAGRRCGAVSLNEQALAVESASASGADAGLAAVGLLNSLNARDRDVLCRVIVGGQTRAAVGRELKLSRERVRQIVFSSLEQLRQSATVLGVELMAA